MRNLLHVVRREEGHVNVAGGAAIPAIGAVLLAIGAANDTGWLTIAGGIVAAAGILLYDALRHSTIDKGIYGRLDRIDGNKPLEK